MISNHLILQYAFDALNISYVLLSFGMAASWVLPGVFYDMSTCLLLLALGHVTLYVDIRTFNRESEVNSRLQLSSFSLRDGCR